MKMCAFCEAAYGSGDQCREKFCSDKCREKFSAIKSWCVANKGALGFLNSKEVHERFLLLLTPSQKNTLYECLAHVENSKQKFQAARREVIKLQKENNKLKSELKHRTRRKNFRDSLPMN